MRCDGDTEGMYHSIAQTRHDDWDEHLPHVESVYNNSVNSATGPAPNETHLGSFPRLPLIIIQRRGAWGHSLRRFQFEYCDLGREHERLAYQFVEMHNVVASSRIARAKDRLNEILR